MIDLLAPIEQLSPEQRDQATHIFNAIIGACEPSQPNSGPYKKITLVRLTYEYARSEASRDNFLQFFFQHTQIPIEVSEWKLIRGSNHGSQLIAFADTLVENFFLPRVLILSLLTVELTDMGSCSESFDKEDSTTFAYETLRFPKRTIACGNYPTSSHIEKRMPGT